jgi:hypothetical protein
MLTTLSSCTWHALASQHGAVLCEDECIGQSGIILRAVAGFATCPGRAHMPPAQQSANLTGENAAESGTAYMPAKIRSSAELVMRRIMVVATASILHEELQESK